MRRMNTRTGLRSRGVSLIEALVTVTIAAILLAQGLPAFAEYLHNSRLRSAGHLLLEQALFAQNEAIRRNGAVRVRLSGSNVEVLDASWGPPKVLRSIELPGKVQAQEATIEFGSLGRPAPFGTSYAIALSSEGIGCTGETRCPTLQIDAGGGVSLCNNGSPCR